MDMINNHFEQITLSANAIADLPFPPPKVFTNALLQPHDITALIRDTEVHERALFTATAPEPSSSRKSIAPGAASGENALSALKPNTAVGRILGSDLQRRIRRSERTKGDVDVDLILEGAQKLCLAYPIPGVLEKIQALQQRHERLASSIAVYESKLADQTAELQRFSQHRNEFEDDDDLGADPAAGVAVRLGGISLEDEESELKQLEQKKRGLEDRVTDLERDLGGLRS